MQEVTIRTAAEESEEPVEIDLEKLEETLEYIRPAIQMDGGDLILLGTEGGTVNLQMVGACGGCPMSTMTLKAGIERILRDRVPGVIEVNAEA
jgi:Fe-S cluster biogenesis protein NfuA